MTMALTANRSALEPRVRQLLTDGDGDAAATAVLEGLGPGVLGYLVALLPEDDAHDAFAAFQVDVWRGLSGFRWECSLRAWAYRVASRAAARLRRDGYRRRREPLPSASALAPPAPLTSGPGGRHDELARLREALPPEEQALLALRVGRGMEWGEVCAVLAADGEEISPVAVRKRFERLKRKLAVLARQRGLLS